MTSYFDLLLCLSVAWFLIILPGEIMWHLKDRARKKAALETRVLLLLCGYDDSIDMGEYDYAND